MKKWTEREFGFAEGYAAAMDDILDALAESFSGKSYDPMTIDGDTIHSYAFDLKDGGRHHPLEDYSSVAELCGYVRRETISALNAARTDQEGIWHGALGDKPIVSWRENETHPLDRRNHYNALRADRG